MSYDDKENSIEEGEPYFLYEFNTNSTVYRYIDQPDDFPWNGETWTSFPVKHSEVKQSNEMSKNSLNITIPISGAFADMFIGWSPDHQVSVTIRRGHFGEGDTVVYWKGRIANHKLSENSIEFKCESIFTSLRRPGLRGRFLRTCRHSIYTVGCNVNKDDFLVEGVPTDVSGLNITIAEAAGEDDGWFIGGIVEFPDGSTRTVRDHVGSLLVVNRASRLALNDFDVGYGQNYGQYYGGFGLKLYPGCDRTLTTCIVKFNNVLNQGSFKWIPQKNPMGGSSIV